MAEKIGFISTRFAGNDGVSLESLKWAEVLENELEGERKCECFWYAGRIDNERPCEKSFCIPEAFFDHPENQWINKNVWGKIRRERLVTRRINKMAEYLKETIYIFQKRFNIDFFIIENALTIPMHIPLGLAITEFIAETNFPAIAHHHDFYWERLRFSVNAVQNFLELAFPPKAPQLQHIVINQAAREQLCWRKGVPATLIPNILNYEKPPAPMDNYACDLKREIGLEDDDIIILQPTRIVSRKGIEHSIKLVQMLKNPKYKLVISHEAGDEGHEYLEALIELARESKVDMRLVSPHIREKRQVDYNGKKKYTLWDLYLHADLVSYPSIYEGFGNAFLEAIYFKLPLLVNRYSIFAQDIEPKGFKIVTMDSILTNRLAQDVKHILENEVYRREVVEHNYELAKRFYSYSVLKQKLSTMIINIKGLSNDET